MTTSVQVRKAGTILLVLLVSALGLVLGTPPGGPAIAGTGPGTTSHGAVAALAGGSHIAVDNSSDATGILSVGQTLNWTHRPIHSPTLVTVSCAAHQFGIVFAITYGSANLSLAVKNQQSNMFVGLYDRTSPSSGPQRVAVKLTATNGTAHVQCSATTWTGTSGVDLTLDNSSQAMSGTATSLALRPRATVPSAELFLGAIHRYMPEGAPTLSISSTGAKAFIVDSNTAEGSGAGHGCLTQNNGWEDCIGTGGLPSSGTSMSYSWTFSGYAVAVGIGIKSS